VAAHHVRAQRAITLWDRVYRAWYCLDAPASRIPPLLSIRVGHAWRPHHLSEGTVLRAGDRYGELHLHNASVVALRERGLSSLQLGLEFRRQLRASLTMLTRLCMGSERFATLPAFSAITIFHQGLARLGFEIEPGGLLSPRLTGAYQRALLRALAARPGLHRSLRAERLWISRPRLLTLYGPRRRVL
jgi:YkoP-like protein